MRPSILPSMLLLVCMNLIGHVQSQTTSPTSAPSTAPSFAPTVSFAPTPAPTGTNDPFYTMDFAVGKGVFNSTLSLTLTGSSGNDAQFNVTKDVNLNETTTYSISMGRPTQFGWTNGETPSSIKITVRDPSTVSVVGLLVTGDLTSGSSYYTLNTTSNKFTALSIDVNTTISVFGDIAVDSFPFVVTVNGDYTPTVRSLALPYMESTRYTASALKSLISTYGSSTTLDKVSSTKLHATQGYYNSTGALDSLCDSTCTNMLGLYQSWSLYSSFEYSLGWMDLTIYDNQFAVTYDTIVPTIKAIESSINFTYSQPENATITVIVNEPGTYYVYGHSHGYNHVGSTVPENVLSRYFQFNVSKDTLNQSFTISFPLNQSSFYLVDDWSYSAFDILFYAVDDGLTDTYSVNTAPGFNNFLNSKGISFYPLLISDAKATVLTYSLSFNHSQWLDSRVVVDSTDFSSFDHIMELAPIVGNKNYTTEFGTTVSLRITPLYTEKSNRMVVMTASTDNLDEAVASLSQNAIDDVHIVMDGSNDYYFYVIGQDDGVTDGDQTVYAYAYLKYSNDPRFAYVPEHSYVRYQFQNVEPTNTLIESYDPTFNVTMSSDYTSEDGESTTLYVSLNEQPVGNIVVGVSISDLTEAMISSGNLPLLVFTPDSYTDKEVTVVGVSDDVVDGDIFYDVIFSVIESDDPAYTFRYAETHFTTQLVNRDSAENRIAVDLSATTCSTSESGSTCTFDVLLCPRVTGLTSCSDSLLTQELFLTGIDHITVQLEIDDITEGAFVSVSDNGHEDITTTIPTDGSTAKIVFREASDVVGGPYKATVTVEGVDDFLGDGDQTFTVSVTDAFVYSTDNSETSIIDQTDGVYVSSVTYTNADNDDLQFLEADPATCYTSESGTQCQVSVSADFSTASERIYSANDTALCVRTFVTIAYELNYTHRTVTEIVYWNSSSNWLSERPNVRFNTTDYFGSEVEVFVTDSDIKLNNSGAFVFTIGADQDLHRIRIFNKTKSFCLPPTEYTVAQGNKGASLTNKTVWSSGWRMYISNPVTDVISRGPLPLFTATIQNVTVAKNVSVFDENLGQNVIQYKNVTSEKRIITNTTLKFTANLTDLPLNVPYSTPSQIKSIVTVQNVTATGLSVSGRHASPPSSLALSVVNDVSTVSYFANFSSSGALVFNVSSIDDMVDDSDSVFQITARPTRVEAENGVFLPQSYDTMSLAVHHYDDDTAGILLSSLLNETLYAYRDNRSPPSDSDTSARRFLDMTYNTTSEGGNYTNFTVALTSQPLSDVELRVTVGTTTNHGYTRMEGVVVGSSYSVRRKSATASWLTGGVDTVTNPDDGYLSLTFTTSDWNVPQTVSVMGLDDLVDDGDQSYVVYVSPVSTNADSYYTPTNLKSAKVPLINIDNEESNFVVMNTSSVCSEPYYGLDAELEMYITSQPLDDIIVKVLSSDPGEAKPDTNFVFFTPENFQTSFTVTVSSVDDFLRDGDIPFTVTTSLVSSGDSVYDASVNFDYDFSMVSKDDPNDVQASAYAVIMMESDVSYTTESGDSVTVSLYLNSTPQDLVFVSVTTSDLTEAQVDGAPTSLVFTSDNYNIAQTVTVTGLSDSLQDGDVPYYFVASITGTDDPYYSALGVGTPYTLSLTNRDYYYNRVRVNMFIAGSTELTESSSSTTLTVQLCLAQLDINGDVDTTSCEAIDTTDLFDAGADRVIVKLALDDTTEAMISDLSDSQINVEYDGSAATLTFDSTSSSLTKNLTISSVNDMLNDGTQNVTISVSDAYVAVNRVKYTVASQYTASDVTLTVSDDDGTSRFAYLDPSTNYVSENGLSSTVTILFNWDVGFGGYANFSLNDGSAVEIASATTLSAHIQVIQSGRTVTAYGTCVSCSGIQSVALVVLSMTDDSIDNGDSTTYATMSSIYEYNVTTQTQYNSTSTNLVNVTTSTIVRMNTTVNGTVSYYNQTVNTTTAQNVSTTTTKTANNTGVSFANETASIMIFAVDDDTSGIVFTQGSSEFVAYRNPTDDTFDVDNLRTISLPLNATSENGTAVTFNVSLSAQPTDVVDVTFTSQVISDKWGSNRMEGIPYGSTYVVESYDSDAPFITGTKDSVTNPTSGSLVLSFTPHNWNMSQSVTIIGLDDYAADGDMDYLISADVSSTSTYYSSSYFANSIRVPLKNLDDEKASFVIMQNGTNCSEPYYGLDAYLNFYTTSEPLDDIVVTFSSLMPGEASVSDDLVTITPQGWDMVHTVTVSSVDDFLDDGDIDFTVRMSLLTSLDPDYADVISTETFDFTSLDDPTDTTDRMDVGLTFSFADDSATTTTELGGEVELQLHGTLKPLGRVVYSVTVSDTTEANILYPSVIVLTPTNYATDQSVIIKGVGDSIADGDQLYNVRFDLISSDDPYYEAMGTVTYQMTNTEVVYDRIALGVDWSDCRSVTEGDGSCQLQLDLCLTREEWCQTKLTAEEIYDLGVDRILINASMDSPHIAYFSGPDANAVSINDDGSLAVITFSSGSSYELSGGLNVSAFDDTAIDGTKRTNMTFSGSIIADGVVYNVSEIYNRTVDIVAHDDESYRIVLERSVESCVTTEEGGQCSVIIRLGAVPAEDVELYIVTDAAVAEFTLAQGTESGDCDFCTKVARATGNMTFTSSDWFEERLIIVTGLDDTAYQSSGYTPYYINVTAVTVDSNYTNQTANLLMRNQDNDIATLEVYQGSSPIEYTGAESVDENGLSRVFKVRLADPLSAGQKVFVDIASSDTTEGVVSVDVLAFNESNAQEWQFVNYTGVDDKKTDGNIDFTITLGPLRGNGAASSDGTFEFLVTNYDNELISIGSLSSRRKLLSSSNIFEIYESAEDGATSDSFSISFPTWQSGSIVSYTRAVVTITFDQAPGQMFDVSFDDIGTTSVVSSTCTDSMTDSSCQITFNSAQQDYEITMTSIDDLIDFGDQHINMTLSTTVFYSNQAGSSSVDAEPVVAQVRKYDDDTAGFLITQINTTTGEQIYSQKVYKSTPRGIAQPTASSVDVINLPDYITKEAAGTRDGNISFYVKLLTEPNGTVTVQAVPQQVTYTDGSATRYEGVAVPNSYTWTHTYYPYLEQTLDTVTLSTTGHHQFEFDSTNWNTSVEVQIRGLNDLYDDSSVDYNITLETSSTDTIYSTAMPDVVFPLTNEDDDVAGIGYEWASGNTIGQTSEPELGLSDTLYYWLTAQPVSSVLLSLTSTDTNGATSVGVDVIATDDWTEVSTSSITSVDDQYADGTVYFDIVIQVLYSTDDNYGTTAENADGVAGLQSVSAPAVSYDDSTDSASTACDKGEYGRYDVGVNNECEDCPAGRFADVAGDKTHCRACPPGTFGYYTSGESLGEGSDWDGSLLPPACLPCPNGTYQDGFNATSCIACPSGSYCTGLATVTPRSADVSIAYADSFANGWDTVSTDEFQLNTYSIWDQTTSDMNQSDYEAYCMSVGLFAWALAALLISIIYVTGNPIRKLKMVRIFRTFDLFAREHVEEAKDEEHADVERAPSALGGILSIAVIVLTLTLVVIMIITFINFNTDVIVALSLYSDSFRESITMSFLTISIDFVGFSGCRGSQYLPLANVIGGSTVPTFGHSGLSIKSYGSYDTSYECTSDGDLRMIQSFTYVSVSTTPEFTFDVDADCQDCTSSGESPLTSGNTVYTCAPCSLSSTQAFAFTVETDHLYSKAEKVHKTDNNTVSGTVFPSSGYAFHGSSTSQVEVNIMPAEYHNYQTGKSGKAYRLIYSDSSVGSENTFDFNSTGLSGYGVDASDSDVTTYSDRVIDNGFVDVDTENTVSFTLRLPLTTSKLSIDISDASTFQNFLSELGGLFGAVAGMFVIVMHYVERGYDKEDVIGKLSTSVAIEMSNMREKLHEAMYPEPEVWQMDNIARLERREKKKTGQEEDEAVKNFKDLLERSKTEGPASAAFSPDDYYDDDDEEAAMADLGRL